MKYKNYWSLDTFYTNYPASTTQSWCDTDNPKNSILGSDDCSVSYRFNSRGFRSRPLERVPGKKNILVSGCSHTLGIGLSVEDTWPEILSTMIEDSVVHNVAIGGGSCDYVARSIYLADKILKADLIFVLWPDPNRLEYYTSEGANEISVHASDYPKSFVNGTHHYNTYLKNLEFVKNIARDRPFYYGSVKLARAPDSAPRARDGIHNSVEWNRFLAEAFYIKYKEDDREERFSVSQDIIDYKDRQ